MEQQQLRIPIEKFSRNGELFQITYIELLLHGKSQIQIIRE